MRSAGRGRRAFGAALVPVVAAALAACATAGADDGPGRATAALARLAPAADSVSAALPAPDPGPAPAPLPTVEDADSLPTGIQGRLVHEQAWTPFASVGEVVLHHPSARVERVAFHESTHDGALEQTPLPSAANPGTMPSRGRGTPGRTAADVVVDPGVSIRAPVSGRVVRGGSYVLYCQHDDHFVVIRPDAHPSWEVKILHLADAYVRAGDRVEAGVTVLAPGPTLLPFSSQVDDLTARPAWPHVHVEVIDPAVPDVSSGSC